MIASLLFGLVAGSGLTWAFMSLRRDHYRNEYITRRGSNPAPPRNKPVPPPSPPLARARSPFVSEFQQQINDYLGMTEGPTQRGNGNGGPTTSKPQPTGGRLIGADGVPIGYQPRSSRPGANPPPREP